MENIKNVELFVQQLSQASSGLERKLQPLLSKSLVEHALQMETPLDKLKLYNNYLYVLISVIYAYLKSIGEDTNKHPIMKELGRIKSYMARAKQLEADLNKKDTSKEDAQKAKNYLQQALGGKINGGGAAATANLTTPAISKHTKFLDDEKIQDAKHDIPDAVINRTKNSNSVKSAKSKNKVTKPTKKSKKT